MSEEFEPIIDLNGDVRYFNNGTICCSECKTKDNIHQFNIESKIKNLPVTKIIFLCKQCAIKNYLIKE
jgi:hypothetical protein